MTIFIIVGIVLLVILTEKYWNNIVDTSDKLDPKTKRNSPVKSPVVAGRFAWLDLWLNYSSIDDKKEDKK
ncbi:MAG: hypothetical protein Q3988_03795 [Gemella sp.]|nr:hypothetical protein [Gemella sp.]